MVRYTGSFSLLFCYYLIVCSFTDRATFLGTISSAQSVQTGDDLKGRQVKGGIGRDSLHMVYVSASHSHSLVSKWPCSIIPVFQLHFYRSTIKDSSKTKQDRKQTVDRMRIRTGVFAVLAVLCLVPFRTATGLLRRCVNCRSRGELGSCKDPFTMNSTEIEMEKGVDAVPCASGWCGKIIERQGLNNEYGTATQRLCFQRGPDDGEERCAYTVWNYKKVYMCLCFGDLCNGTTGLSVSNGLIVTTFAILFRWFV